MNIERIGILCGYSFPNGMAPTARIIAYSKGLVQNGVDVHVIIFRPTDRGGIMGPREGYIDGIHYIYPFKRSWSNYRLSRWFWDRPVSYLLMFSWIIKANKKNKFDYIFLSFDLLRFLFIIIPFLKLFALKIIFIADEFPIPIRHYLKDKIPHYKIVLYKFIFIYLDGMVLMTTHLKNFFNHIKEKPTYLLPSITDLSRFNKNYSEKETLSENRFLCYMGNMELAKDNVDNIINAFYLIHKKYPDIDLHLYGTPSSENLSQISSLIETLKLNKRVLFKGRVDYADVPIILKKAYILVSSQPDTKRAAGGFPTKLGEYLASGVPVIVTDVGEINRYVKNGEHLWLAKPNDPLDYSLKIEYIISNYNKAKEIAQYGKQYAMKNFDCVIVAKGLKKFLDNLIVDK